MNVRIRVVSMIVVIGAVALGHAPSAEAYGVVYSGCHAQGAFEVCFTDPPNGPSREDHTIESRLSALIDTTASGDSIRVAMFTWTRPSNSVASHLVSAKARGVDIRVVVDDTNRPNGVLNATIQSLVDASIPVQICSGGCLWPDSDPNDDYTNHNKLFLINRVSSNPAKIVGISSQNQSNPQMELYNNLLLVTGDATLYDFYFEYWRRLATQSWTYNGVNWSTNADRTAAGSFQDRAAVFPRTGTDDHLAEKLLTITACPAGHDQVYIATGDFKGDRPAVKSVLEYLDGTLGCDVRVITRDPGTATAIPNVTPVPFGERYVQDSTALDGSKIKHHCRLHDKIVLIDAEYNHDLDKIVLSGSANVTGWSMWKSDDAWLQVNNNSFVYNEYLQHFNSLYSVALQLSTTSLPASEPTCPTADGTWTGTDHDFAYYYG
jgi:phosphatidylserine/phosphatidylglycerophosphate/cardiolipin synthase-like enzyme